MMKDKEKQEKFEAFKAGILKCGSRYREKVQMDEHSQTYDWHEAKYESQALRSSFAELAVLRKKF